MGTLRVCLALLLFTAPAFGQTATTAQITGLVADSQGGVLPGVVVTLRDQKTNVERTVVTNEAGRYAFPNLEPSNYTLTANLDQFKTSIVSDILAEVTRTVTRDVVLDVGTVDEIVTVSAAAEAVLQTRDAAVGHTFDNLRISALPTTRGDASQLMTLQPAISPVGEVAGARRDQSTFVVDGIDVSEKAFGVAFELVLPTPTDSIEELNTAVSNANASFGRSSGGQYTFITRRGTNRFRGSLYENHQNESLGSNSWTNNRLGIDQPAFRDNRFGASIGGPILRNKTFFFGLYEGQRLSTGSTVTHLVPTASLKQGLLRFRDAAGNINTVDPRTFDPRGLGANSVILSMLQGYPAPNDDSGGDGLNTSGHTVNYPLETTSNLGILRIDHSFSSNWQADVSIKAFNSDQDTTEQLNLFTQSPAAALVSRPRSTSSGLKTVIGSSMTNEMRFGWVRDNSDRRRTTPPPQVSGLNVAVDLAGTLLGEPIDVGRAASNQSQTVDIYQFSNNFTWARKSHTLQSGLNLRRGSIGQIRTNKVIGTITTPFAELTSATFNPIPAGQRPAFILPVDVTRYNQLYAALLGQIETVGFLATRDRNLQPLPVGTPMIIDSALNTYDFYASDTWQVSQSLSLTYGLRYQLQTPPSDPNGLASLLTYADSGEVVSPVDYLERKAAAAATGVVFNPTLGWLPVEQTNSSLHRLDRNNLSPRIAAAWNPSFEDGVLGALFGDRRTVLRGGYALVYDRVNIPSFNTVPALAPTFAQVISLNAPRNAAGDVFRVGVDGSIPLPTLAPTTAPVIPSTPFGEVISQGIDPFITTPYNHTVDLTFQRGLPGNLTIEVGYLGRFARSLIQGIGLNSVPYFFKDPASGQTFAQAYDQLAAQLRSGVPASAVTAQPWFENLLPRLAPAAGVSRTTALAQAQAGNVINGNISALFLGYIDALAAEPFNNQQVQSISFRSSVGRSNYNGGFVSVRKRFATGFAFDANYTLSRSLDQVGVDQTSSAVVPNSYFLDAEYGISNFDLTHIMNANGLYELPFGQGRRFLASSSGLLGALISGWYTAGIYRASSGMPMMVVQGNRVWGGDIQSAGNTGAIPIAEIETGLFEGVAGSGGVGTGGNPATGGTGLNVFSDPQAAFQNFRRIRLSDDTTTGRNVLRGPGFWQVDLTVGKATRLTSGITLRLAMDMVNAFNTVNYSNPVLSVTSPATFGVIASQRISESATIGPRQIRLTGRIEF